MSLPSFSFVVPVAAVGKGRPRFDGRRTITPAPTRQYENLVKLYAQRARPKDWPTDGVYSVEVRIYERCGKGGRRGPAPDVDNVAKAILDPLNGIAFLDDRQVDELVSRRWWSDTQKAEVGVTVRLVRRARTEVA